MAMARRDTSGTFSITSPGISQRVDTSSPTLGSALSKALTIGMRLQRELKAAPATEEDVTIDVRRLGGDVLGRILIARDLVQVVTVTTT